MQTVEEGSGSEDQNACDEETPLQIEISKLRRRWELASVLNFLDVTYSSYVTIRNDMLVMFSVIHSVIL